MASDSNGDEFPGFEVEEADRARVLRRQLSESGESDISVSSESDSSSEKSGEPVNVWTTDDSPVRVDDFTERSGPVSGVAEDGTALDFFPEELFACLDVKHYLKLGFIGSRIHFFVYQQFRKSCQEIVLRKFASICI